MKFKVKNVATSQNVQQYGAAHIPHLGSKGAVKKAIGRKELYLNGRPVKFGDQVSNGDVIEWRKEETVKKTDTRTKYPTIDIPILYEDEYLVIVNKPGGIAVNGNRHKTVEHLIKNHIEKSTQQDALPAPVATHRLDVPTKGLVMLAKTKSALVRLNRLFQQKKIDKKYVAIVHESTPEKGTILQPIDGKPCHTEFKKLKQIPSGKYQHFSLLELTPVTGRTHQLRIHCADKGHLIVGDKMYAGKRPTIHGKGLFLAAIHLTFQHPFTNEKVEIKMPVPYRFTRFLEKEEQLFFNKKEGIKKNRPQKKRANKRK